nr:integumentary mucin C.1 [Bactrocera oleae]
MLINELQEFYRCVRDGDSYTKYEFSCAKGTGWSEDKQTCDYAVNIKRCEGQTEEPETSTITTETTTESSTLRPNVNSMDYNGETFDNDCHIDMEHRSWDDSTTTTTNINHAGTNLPPGKTCEGEGYMADPMNCKKFYRCVREGDSYTKYEFTCAKGTGWSEDKQTCDYAANIERCEGQTEEPETSTIPTETTTESSTTTVTAAKPTTEESSTTTIVTQEPTTVPTQTTTVQTSTAWTTTEKPSTTTATSTWSTEAGNDSTTTSQPTSTTPVPNLPPGQTCEGEGYMADPMNCRKFYRCVRDGDSYTKYEFSCAKGTGWSEDKQTCDYAVNIERCEGQTEEPETSTIPTETPTESSTTTVTAAKPTTEESRQLRSPNVNSMDTTEKPSTTTATSTWMISSPTSTTPVPNLPPGQTCEGEGYMADPMNCKKFYRCVREGDSYTKYEFTCAKGTGWSEDKQTCDYAANIERCERQTEEPETSTIPTETTLETSTTPKPGEWSTTTQSTQATTILDTTTQQTTTKETSTFPESSSATENSTTGLQETTTTTSIPTDTTQYPVTSKPGYKPTTSAPSTTDKPGTDYTTTPSITEEYPGTTVEPVNHVCTNEGFYPDPQDCNRYYRCVDASKNGKYQIYSFRCPDGTVWDTSLEICNFPNSVSGNCSNSSGTATTTEDATTEWTTTSSTEKPTKKPEKPTTEQTTTDEPTTVPTTSTTEQSTTTTQEPSTEPTSTTLITTTTEPTTTTEIYTTTEQSTVPPTTTTESVTTIKPSPASNHSSPCPQIGEGQNTFVCPTGFRRHPKSCDLFYQCTEKAESYDMAITVFECPKGTVYHEQRNLCDKPDKNDNCLKKSITRSGLYDEQIRFMNMIQIRSVGESLCPDEGHFALNKDECSQLFIKCAHSPTTGRLEGQLFRCPQGFAYWTVSRRCERAQKLLNCTPAKYETGGDLPVEWANIGNRRRNLKI